MSDRYPKHHIERGTDMVVRGQNLGPALKPQDVFVWLKLLMGLDDEDVLAAFAAVPGTDPARTYPELTEAEIAAMLIANTQVTRSRITAWRKRNREMTWLELRALFLGLRATG